MPVYYENDEPRTASRCWCIEFLKGNTTAHPAVPNPGTSLQISNEPKPSNAAAAAAAPATKATTTAAMTPFQLALISVSWKHLVAETGPSLGKEIFREAFQAHPDLKKAPAFEKAVKSETVDGTTFDTVDDDTSAKVVEQMGLIVDKLSKGEAQASTLKELGKQLSEKGIKPEDYDKFMEALLVVAEKKLDVRFNAEVNTACRKAFKLVHQAIHA
mmetsp:Transcript_82909/g.173598  ORF Transcript_82909/g.173598 Transcript_82909/m.173598 type:complete len:215 (-) Transcript_82909:61-705(-)|eukprot:CAMPEP_0206459564 /NCGR_PEP_ID=MMETSP0324_2-20121206/24250_1 /ASSEMBLY_ACC=CAM_ASM_000836 /TAXON_ID=2866 /ORGANISM="Crypthecodinium cohnii, Strain Seligo" /LENGTH=214 /DNA_ID=CAMNT_0053931137 /DNA_START=111 /DNA_END=755 /DNA_ORIENTATION=-